MSGADLALTCDWEVTPPGFFEAAYLTKHDGKYYEIYAAGSNPASVPVTRFPGLFGPGLPPRPGTHDS